MIIVWLSIALVIVALIWVVVKVVKESRRIKDTVIRCAKLVEKIRKDSEKILKQKERLQDTREHMTMGYQKKVDDLKYVSDQGKELVDTLNDKKDQLVEAYGIIKNKLEV